MRHANMAGTSPLGGVLMAMGDDHTGESSTTLHQSDFALIDAMMPILSPAGVQEILDYGLLGIAMSRFAGVWVGLKCTKDTIEVTSVVDARNDRINISLPNLDLPDGGLNIRLVDLPINQEERLHRYKKIAVEEFARSNKIDQHVHGKSDSKIGFVAAGKNWLDLAHSMQLLGLDEDECNLLKIKTYKIGMIWPLDTVSFKKWCQDLDFIIVIEEKRKILEPQIKEVLFDNNLNCSDLAVGNNSDRIARAAAKDLSNFAKNHKNFRFFSKNLKNADRDFHESDRNYYIKVLPFCPKVRNRKGACRLNGFQL